MDGKELREALDEVLDQAVIFHGYAYYAIESLNARYRRAIRARGHSPTERPR